ncbi:hypothetical protein B0H13DRAFT_2315925 [Mycena leptocephala]|nr:hypothetical protein B0H13DRAFT_2315925 [Mycena leptocephala]
MFRVAGKTVHITFKNALHAPSLSANLVSVSQFDKAGYWSKFGGGEVCVQEGEGGMTLLRGRGSDGMYVLDVDNTHAKISTANPVDQEMAPADARSRANASAAERVVNTHAHTTVLTLPPLELVAFDLWGPCRVASPGGNVYMMPIVDSGTSHKHRVAFLKDKSDDSIIKAFDEYRVMAERQTGHHIKRRASPIVLRKSPPNFFWVKSSEDPSDTRLDANATFQDLKRVVEYG